jgi:hypothetical protein
VPDTRYGPVKELLELSGWTPGTKVPSKHGKYTNTRWEWFPKPKTKVKNETSVPAINV